MNSSVEYMEFVEEKHTDWCGCQLKVNWIVKNISGEANANGYIVQHFKRTVEPIQTYLKNDEYYEAWRVTEGKIADVQQGTCDDEYCIGTPIHSTADISFSLGTKGKIVINAEVYWIPQTSDLYEIVEKWDTSIEATNGLKGSKSFSELTESYFVFSRPSFLHEWDLRNVERVKEILKKRSERVFPNATQRDEDLLKEDLDVLFRDVPPAFSELKKQLFNEWCMLKGRAF